MRATCGSRCTRNALRAAHGPVRDPCDRPFRLRRCRQPLHSYCPARRCRGRRSRGPRPPAALQLRPGRKASETTTTSSAATSWTTSRVRSGPVELNDRPHVYMLCVSPMPVDVYNSHRGGHEARGVARLRVYVRRQHGRCQVRRPPAPALRRRRSASFAPRSAGGPSNPVGHSPCEPSRSPRC